MAYEPCSACGSTKGPEHMCPGLASELVGKVLDGRYQVEAILGQGGMGMVFEAIQTSVHRPVAVKTLHPALAAAPQFFERFRREAEIASRLRHPNIITIFDFGRTEDGTCYYVMELLEGESLKQIVKRDGPMSLRRSVGVIEQAAKGLAHAHKQNVIHRDLKPHNIMIQSLDGQDFVKVLDFGLVKALEADEDEQLTSTGQVLGTPQYMPPEQAGGETVDQRSDLYSLAGVFYYCLTGTSPFGANTVRKALNAALTQTVPPVGTHRKGAPVPKAVDEFARKAMAREKEDRYQTAEELIAEMKAAVEGLTDEALDVVPGNPALEGKEPGSGSHSGANAQTLQGRARGQATPSSPSKARPSSKVIVSPEADALTAGRRPTAGEIPSAKGSGSASATAAPRRSGKLLLAGAALAGLAVGGAGYWKLRGSGEAEAKPPQPIVAEPVLAPQPPLPPQDRAGPAEEVNVRLLSTPSGAAVLDEAGVVLGKTPLERKWPKDRVHTVRFQLAGHAELARSFQLSKDETLEVQLEPARSPAGKPSGSPKKKPGGEDIPVFE
ncbi:MAG: serine/threonine protein kinase [Myxococcales bacterium]|nr:serine/threonine protein kinase [Myxococcales bacterium]